jgi:hypothetical protein
MAKHLILLFMRAHARRLRCGVQSKRDDKQKEDNAALLEEEYLNWRL